MSMKTIVYDENELFRFKKITFHILFDEYVSYYIANRFQ